MALGTELALAFLPLEPGFLDGVSARAAIHVGQIEEFAETAALGTPTLHRVVAEEFWVERLKRARAFGAGPFGGMNRRLAVVIESEKRSAAKLQCFIDELLQRFTVLRFALAV